MIDRNKFLVLAMSLGLGAAACTKPVVAPATPNNEAENTGEAGAYDDVGMNAPTDECVDWDPSGECIEWAGNMAPSDECVDWDPSGECIEWE